MGVFVTRYLGAMARMGRPPLEKARNVTRGIRLTADEDELIQAAAAAAGQSVAEWCRDRLVAAAKRKR